MYALERAEGAKIALITFGSFTNPGRAEPSFAFMNTVLRMRRNHRIVCDAYYFKARANDWYFSGINGSESFEQSVAELSRIVAGYDRVAFMGNSMGGYAALAFGLSLNTGLILAFNPQTRFDKEFCDVIKERRWRAEFEKMRADYDVQRMAIKYLCPEQCSANLCLFVGGLCPQDVAYVTDLSLNCGFDYTVHEESGHDLVHDLRNTGQLDEIIVDSLNSSVPGGFIRV